VPLRTADRRSGGSWRHLRAAKGIRTIAGLIDAAIILRQEREGSGVAVRHCSLCTCGTPIHSRARPLYGNERPSISEGRTSEMCQELPSVLMRQWLVCCARSPKKRKGPMRALPNKCQCGRRLARDGRFGIDHPLAEERGVADAAGALALIVFRPVLGAGKWRRRPPNPGCHRAL
jgi:hypothetical protein